MRRLLWYGLTVYLLLLVTMSAQAAWEPITGPRGGSVTSIVSTGDRIFVGTMGDGIYVSSDGGETWTASTNGLHNSDGYHLNFALLVYALTVSGTNVYAATWAGAFVSLDEGGSWTPVNNGFTGMIYVDPHVTSIAAQGSILFASTSEGVAYTSADEGTNWTPVSSLSTGFEVLATAGADIFAGSSSGIFVSHDGGVNWSTTSSEVRNVCTIVASGSTVIVGTRYYGIYVSSDNGITWTTSNSGLTNLNIQALIMVGGKLLAGTGDGIYTSEDNGATWSLNCNGIAPGFSRNVQTLTAVNSVLFAGSNGAGVYRSTDSGASWTPSTGPVMMRVVSIANDETTLYAGTYGSGVFRSTDNGASWAAINNDMTNRWITHVYCHGDTLQVCAFLNAFSNFYISTDGGEHWSDRTIDNYQAVASVSIGSHILIGKTSGLGVYLSDDGGWNWGGSTAGMLSLNVTSLAVLGSRVFVSTGGGGVSYSDDSGSTWIPSSNFQPTLSIYELAVAGNDIYAASSEAAYRSSDNGVTWTQVDHVGTRSGSVILPWGNTYFGIGSHILAARPFTSQLEMSGDEGLDWRDISQPGMDLWSSAMGQNSSYVFLYSNANGMMRRPLSEIICCTGATGDVDRTNVVDLSDLSTLVSYLTGSGMILACPEEGNIDGKGRIDLSDLSGLVNYLTGTGGTLAMCP